MTDATATVPTELIDHLCRNSQLTAKQAEHLVNEVLAYFAETPEVYLRKRHQELQSYGRSNPDIFAALQQELNARRFKCKPMTTRQIRRAIYG